MQVSRLVPTDSHGLRWGIQGFLVKIFDIAPGPRPGYLPGSGPDWPGLMCAVAEVPKLMSPGTSTRMSKVGCIKMIYPQAYTQGRIQQVSSKVPGVVNPGMNLGLQVVEILESST